MIDRTMDWVTSKFNPSIPFRSPGVEGLTKAMKEDATKTRSISTVIRMAVFRAVDRTSFSLELECANFDPTRKAAGSESIT